jgi:type VI secretion system FHA domain protein
MELVVRALRCPPPDQPQAIQARFGAQGGRIGRSNTCLLPLPSPDRYISREHLEIRYRDGQFVLKVISKVNGCSVNDNAVPPGAAVELANGDRIELGDYLLVAEFRTEESRASDPLAAFGAPHSARGVDALDMLAALAPPPPHKADPQFDTSPDWLRSGAAAKAPPPRPAPVEPLEADPSASALGQMLEAPSASRTRPPGAHPPAAPLPPFGRDDTGAQAIDAFLGLDGGPLAPAPAGRPMSDQAQGLFRQQDVNLAMTPPPPAASAFDDDIFAALEKDFRPATPAAHAPPAAYAPPPAAYVPAPAPAAIDPLDMDLLAPAPSPAPRAPAPAPAPAPAARAVAPAQAAPAPQAPTPQQAVALPAASGGAAVDGAQLLAVLAQALELEPGELDAAHPLETVRIVGELLNLTVSGLYQMLEMRAQLKNELRIEDRTMIASRENNPLKHSDSARDAMRYLVDVRQHGNKLFMQPSKAIGDAVSDVCAHEMAVMAGTRAALLAALKMFSPEVVEKRIKKSGALDSVMPALYRAKLWESFLTMYGELEKEAEDHFDRLLNQEFARAYAEQGRKLRRKK